MENLFIGLMSGTSMDGIDAALVRFESSSVEVISTYEHDYSPALRQQLFDAIRIPAAQPIGDVAGLDESVGHAFRDAAVILLQRSGTAREDVTAIGSHGQTIRHEPNAARPFSLQVGNGEIIAEGTGITTVTDFRSADIALGGQGAPLAPAFHAWLFQQPGTNRAVLNIGGIANITLLDGSDDGITGFDTGPGNTLLDAWARRHRNEPFDKGGRWAAAGTVDENLLERLLADPYFGAAAPKSTGFEYFNVGWLERAGIAGIEPVDVQATLCELSARSIACAVPDACSDLLVCGGGVHNADLMRRLAALLPGCHVRSTADAGLHPDWVEAAAFAWLAMRTVAGLPGNLPSVTGARQPAVLGRILRAG
jgi:anhydro-N-acetylmuramic acid kinase